MRIIAGKTAFITGGASGMGLGMAQIFGQAGMNVIIADLRPDALDEARNMLEQLGISVLSIELDVTDRDRWSAAVEEAVARFGNIHVLVNNAGVGVAGPMQKASYKDWDFNLSVNVGGVVNGLVTLLPHMLGHGEEGHIVTTSSTGGFSAVGGAGLYCTAKFAVAGMMESLATDLKDTPIGVSVFFPGPVMTALGLTTSAVRPAHLRNADDAPPPSSGNAPPAFDPNIFMSKEEVGQRVLNGIRRKDLFIMSHPEFRDGLIARNEALLRAIPDEPVNEARAAVVRQFGTLIYNPVYDGQTQVPGLELEPQPQPQEQQQVGAA